MKNPRYYAIQAFGIGPFPKFMDNYKTLTQARRIAAGLLRQGFHTVEILRDAKKPAGYFGIPRDIVEALTS